MDCIRIVTVPFGEAPLSVRKAWVGLVLLLTGSIPVAEEVSGYGVISGQPVTEGGYSVDTVMAVEILEEQSPTAANWWREETKWVQPGFCFIFCRQACLLVQSLPGILPPISDGRMTLEQFMGLLDSNKAPRLLPLIGALRGECDWEEARRSPINRVLLMALARLFAMFYDEVIDCEPSETRRRDLRQDGRNVQRTLCCLAARNGVYL